VKQRPREPGGVLLVLAGAPADVNKSAAIADLIAEWQAEHGPLTVLVTPEQRMNVKAAAEVWTWHRLGFKGFLALIRRWSWRHFDFVYDPWPDEHGWLRFMIWPRPKWVLGPDALKAFKSSIKLGS
jgi:hypothetical protein